MKVTLKAITPEPEKTIVEIARVSSSRTDKSENPAKLINYLINHKHWSPFEHAMITMEIVTSKAIGIQLLRHRSFTFQEFSQRYAKVTSVEDIELRLQAEKNRQSSTDVIGTVHINDNITTFRDKDLGNWRSSPSLFNEVQSAIKSCMDAYESMIEAGVAKECARMILPMATTTTIYMSGTIRSWIHLIDIRDDSHAQKEVQLIAKEMKKILIENCPIIAEARGWTND